jgi:hypothetical protein
MVNMTKYEQHGLTNAEDRVLGGFGELSLSEPLPTERVADAWPSTTRNVCYSSRTSYTPKGFDMVE